ncbi:MAG: hypothetical protein U0575_15155 [Phycisphaerales bacterium]
MNPMTRVINPIVAFSLACATTLALGAPASNVASASPPPAVDSQHAVPQTTLTLKLAGRERVGTWSIKGDRELTLEACVRANGAVHLDVVDRAGAAFAEIKLNAAAKSLLADQLAVAVGSRAGAKQAASHAGEQVERRFDSMISFGPYDVPADGTLCIPNVVTNVLPRYRGAREGGGTFIDDRVTFVVQDGAKNMWPVIVLLKDDEAARLAAVLRAG